MIRNYASLRTYLLPAPAIVTKLLLSLPLCCPCSPAVQYPRRLTTAPRILFAGERYLSFYSLTFCARRFYSRCEKKFHLFKKIRLRTIMRFIRESNLSTDRVTTVSKLSAIRNIGRVRSIIIIFLTWPEGSAVAMLFLMPRN